MTTKSRTTRAGMRTTYGFRPAGGLAMQARGGVVM